MAKRLASRFCCLERCGKPTGQNRTIDIATENRYHDPIRDALTSSVLITFWSASRFSSLVIVGSPPPPPIRTSSGSLCAFLLSFVVKPVSSSASMPLSESLSESMSSISSDSDEDGSSTDPDSLLPSSRPSALDVTWSSVSVE